MEHSRPGLPTHIRIQILIPIPIPISTSVLWGQQRLLPRGGRLLQRLQAPTQRLRRPALPPLTLPWTGEGAVPMFSCFLSLLLLLLVLSPGGLFPLTL